jgi:hypothetical protein
LNAQGSFQDQVAQANVVINNSKDSETTLAQVKRAWEAIQTQAARDKSAWLTPAAAPAPTLPSQQLPRVEPPPVIVQKPTPPAPVVEKTIVPPKPVAPPPDWTRPPAEEKELELELRRARKSDLDALAIAFAKSAHLTNPPSRTETLQQFGARGYRVAVADNQVMAFAAWEAENLVAMVRELWADSEPVASEALPALLGMVEDEARQLQCEVLLVLVNSHSPPFVTEQTRVSNFQPRNLQELHPVWRQVLLERIQSDDEIWVKRLREELVTQPF